MADWEDYYEILGVNPDASDEEIKDTYRYKVNILHPDRLAGVSESVRHRAEEDLKKVNRAHDVLKDPQKRKEYHSEWVKRSTGTQRTLPKPKPAVDPTRIQFSDVEPGETQKASFTIRNIGGPYSKIWVSNPDSWVRVTDWESLAPSDELPLEVELEAEGDDWDKSYTEYIRIRLDEEETTVRVELQTKSQPAGAGLSPGGTIKAGTVKSPPAMSRSASTARRLVRVSIFSVITILVIVAVVNSRTQSTPPSPPSPPRIPYSLNSLTTSVSPSESGSISPGSGRYDVDTVVTLTATPSSGYRFDRWSGDASGTSPSIKITMNSNKTIVANFSRIRYSLMTSVRLSGSGSISPSGGTYDSGTVVTLTATPSSGYRFDRWSGDASGKSLSIKITMDSNKTIVANFPRIPYDLPPEN